MQVGLLYLWVMKWETQAWIISVKENENAGLAEMKNSHLLTCEVFVSAEPDP